jgi:hypothetical protein
MTQVATTPQAAQRKRAADFTGRQAQDLAAASAEELKKREGEIALRTQADLVAKSEIVDLTGNGVVDITDEVEAAAAVEVSNPTRKILVREDLTDVTIGFGNSYSFEAGRTYIVPKHVADHLEAQGYVW